MTETQLYSQKPSEPKPEPEPREVALCDTYYSTDDSAETLLCTDPDEAIGEALDLDVEFWPDTITAFCWRRSARHQSERMISGLAESALERIIEELDDYEELGSPDEPTKKTAKMRELSTEFARGIVAEYRPWTCDPEHSSDVTVNTAQWVKEHWLDWDEDPERKSWVEARL